MILVDMNPQTEKPEAFLARVVGQDIPVRSWGTIVGYVSNFKLDDGRIVGEFRGAGRKVLMHREKPIITPNDDSVPNWTAVKFLKAVFGKRLPVSCGHTVVGVVEEFRIEDGCVLGTFQEKV